MKCMNEHCDYYNEEWLFSCANLDVGPGKSMACCPNFKAPEPEPEQSPYHQAFRELAGLLTRKEEAYGKSNLTRSAKIIEILYPNGISPDQYSDALPMIRIIDKLLRIATKKDAFGESPWKDIAGYAGLSMVKDEQEEGK